MAEVRNLSASISIDENSALQEIEVLQAIYIHELNIDYDENGYPCSVTLQLHPSTCENADEQYVCLTLNLQLPLDYPLSVPEIHIKNPRGLADEEITRLSESLNELAEERTGMPMLYELIELAKECLTVGNVPHGHCVICMEAFQETEELTKTECYHHFHCYCLHRYALHALAAQHASDADNHQRAPYAQKKEKEVLCPVCREPLDLNLDWLAQAKAPSGEQFTYQPTREMRNLQKKMAAMFFRQKDKGAIIDVEAERNKFLISADEVVTLPVVGVSPSEDQSAMDALLNPVVPQADANVKEEKTGYKYEERREGHQRSWRGRGRGRGRGRRGGGSTYYHNGYHDDRPGRTSEHREYRDSARNKGERKPGGEEGQNSGDNFTKERNTFRGDSASESGRKESSRQRYKQDDRPREKKREVPRNTSSAGTNKHPSDSNSIQNDKTKNTVNQDSKKSLAVTDSIDSVISNNKTDDVVKEVNQHSDMKGAQKQRSDTRSTQSLSSDTRGTQNRHSDTRGTQNQRSDTRRTQNQRSDTRRTQNQHNDTRGTKNQRSDTRGTHNQRNDTGGTQNQRSDTRGTHNQCNDTGGTLSKVDSWTRDTERDSGAHYKSTVKESQRPSSSGGCNRTRDSEGGSARKEQDGRDKEHRGRENRDRTRTRDSESGSSRKDHDGRDMEQGGRENRDRTRTRDSESGPARKEHYGTGNGDGRENRDRTRREREVGERGGRGSRGSSGSHRRGSAHGNRYHGHQYSDNHYGEDRYSGRGRRNPEHRRERTGDNTKDAKFTSQSATENNECRKEATHRTQHVQGNDGVGGLKGIARNLETSDPNSAPSNKRPPPGFNVSKVTAPPGFEDTR